MIKALIALLLLTVAEPDPQIPPVKSCHTLTDLQDKIKDTGIVQPLMLYGLQALAATDYINNKIGERTYFKADTLVAVPLIKEKAVLIWFVYNDCIDEQPVQIPVKAFMNAINTYKPNSGVGDDIQ